MKRHLPPLLCVASLALAMLMPPATRAQSDDDSARPDSGHPRITAVRHWSLGTVTRIVIESSGEFKFRADRLQNPDRVFFDLVGARPQAGTRDHKGVTVIEVGDQFVRQMRVAETQRGITRVVCDLESPVEFTTSQLSNPDRLVVELRAAATEVTSATPASKRRRGERERVETAKVAKEPKLAPRLAVLDFSATRRERTAPAQIAPLVLPDPPSPFDPWARFARWAYTGPDPLPSSSWYRNVPALPKPPGRILPGTLAKATPPPAPPPVVLAPKAATPSEEGEIGLPAKRTSKEDTMIRVLGLKLGRVVIDAGHGGHDAGTSSDGGLHEKDVVLDVAKRVGALLEERLGSEVVYTRTEDKFVALGRRAEIANEKKADLFLSIHVNSSPARAVGGVETYYLSFTTSKTALDTAMRENAGADRNIGELQDLLKKIALKDKVEESREFASCIQTSLVSLSPKAARPANDRGVKRAPFVVLIGASMPSVLAEIGFISNAHDEAQMRRPEHRQKIAEALYEGVAAYANTLSHFQVAQQQSRLVKSGASTTQSTR